LEAINYRVNYRYKYRYIRKEGLLVGKHA